MRETTENPKKKHICIGMLAHVDAGKTTLTESILYLTGTIRKLGRVDHKDAFLDTDQIERERGITVFSKEARFTIDETDFTLLDTPGHADFSTEMERTLQVLDYGILIVSGADGIQGHTITLWRLLTAYRIPVFVFVNKMDQPGTEKAKILAGLRENLGDGFLDFDRDPEGEDLALCSEKLMESYFATERITEEQIAEAVRERKIYPVVFGSALKLQGTERFLEVLKRFAQTKELPEAFSARVYKITRDKQGVRQTHMKITGGSLRSKMMLSGENSAHQPWEEKADQIRLYSGNSFQLVQEVNAGMVCTVTGLTQTYAGEGLGTEQRHVPLLEPAMTCHILLPSEVDSVVALHKLRELEEEDPMLRFVWKEESKEIHVQVMGELELEILQRRIRDRFQWNVTFGEGSLLYKETIVETSIGIGHFEPLRHYAEVHLLLEPGEKGSGLRLDSICSEDKLDRNWQRLIITHLQERQHPGILTGSPITDMKITLVAGRAHLKHTEGGDFRQATYRAVRQGLRKAECVLLEPVYDWRSPPTMWDERLPIFSGWAAPAGFPNWEEITADIQ